MSDKLRDQYEAYPYPARDPKDEARRLIVGSPSNLAELNHYLFAGRRDFTRPFRALVAGGGTGDAAIMLAQQLAKQSGGGQDEAGQNEVGQVVYLDLSQASRGIAQARAAARGLTNITFKNGSLLDLPHMGEVPFDYIDCCGVLHHLEDPLAGLKALKTVLSETGGMGLMVYAPLGRQGVYETQEMLRQLYPDAPLVDKVTTARRLLEALPESNWLRRNPFVGDHRRSDAELVDLLLHSRDRAYSVGEVAELVEGAGLRLVSFIEPARYEPESYLKDPHLRKGLAGLPPLERAAFAERLSGNIKTHIFYVTKNDTASRVVLSGDTDDFQYVPIFRKIGEEEDCGAQLVEALKGRDRLAVTLTGLKVNFALPRLAGAMVAQIDGVRDLTAIHQNLWEKDSRLDQATFMGQFQDLYKVLNGLNNLFLKRSDRG